MKKFMTALFLCMFCFCGVMQLNAEEADGMPTDQLLFITLAETANKSPEDIYRWNANGSALSGNVIHLDNFYGENCNFMLYQVKDDKGIYKAATYGIKHIKEDGVDYFADIDGKSTDPGAALHLWESSDEKINGDKNKHRQFQFYYVETDQYGNKIYYIKNVNSGLYLGYEGADSNKSASYNAKIVQTTTPVKWIVSKATVPEIDGEEKTFIKNNDPLRDGDAAFVEMFKKGTLETVNRDDDESDTGTKVHYFEMGTSSKWRITWHEIYAAYTIEAVENNEADVSNKEVRVWEVDNDGYGYGKKVKLQSLGINVKNYKTSQLWRFIKANDGYQIRNVKNGLYINDDLSSSGGFVTDYYPETFTIDVISNSNKTNGKESNDVSFNYAEDWMSGIPDDAYLSSVNIPSTHDTGTAYIEQGDTPQVSFTSCQKYFYGEQLNVGARSFDIRCNAISDDADVSQVKIVHGGERWQCYNRDGSELTLQNIFDDSIRFLKEHSSEALILMVKADDGSMTGLARAIGAYIKNHKQYFYNGKDVPSMGEARGKIILVRRYVMDTKAYDPASDGLDMNYFGIDLSDWDNYSYSKGEYAMNIYSDTANDIFVYAQDAYNEYSSGKKPYIEGTMKQTTDPDENSLHAIPKNAWIYNYTSCAVGFPLGLTREINPWLYEDKMGSDGKGYIDNRRLGMVMLNFIDSQLSKLVYETNNAGGSFYAAKVNAPTTVKLTYGQKLSEAELKGQTGDGTWTFADGDYVPTYEDYKNGKTFEVVFTSNKGGFRATTAQVAITDFTKKTIKVTVDNKTISYGDEIPELTYTIDEATPLVKNDTADDLRITLQVEEIPESGLLTVGSSWCISGSSQSDMYDVKITNGFLNVKAKEITIEADNQNKTYGQETPELTWHMDETQLVGGDNKEDLAVVLTAGAGDDKGCKAGSYKITLTQGYNANYSIDCKAGTLIVNPKIAEIRWENTTNIKVGGEGPRAVISNLEDGDSCTVLVEYEDDTGLKGTDIPSWTQGTTNVIVFTATIAGLDDVDKGNYVLSETNREIQYYVRRNEPTDYHMPEEALMTYGQSLSEAQLILAAGDGTFTLGIWKNNQWTDLVTEGSDPVPKSAGDYQCQVKFTPVDTADLQPVIGDITIHVAPKAITVNALAAEKTYGEETELAYTADESQLVLEDTIDDLGLTLTALNQSGDGDSIDSPVGTYEITMADYTNKNYQVTYNSSWLDILKKEINLKWSDVSNLVYTGAPVNVTAEAEGILAGDVCDVRVIGGNKIQPGNYNAFAVSLTNSNYRLPRDYKTWKKEYTIKQAEETPVNPTSPADNTNTPKNDNTVSNVPVSKISISGISKKIAAGKKIQLSTTISPSNAINKNVSWKSSNTKYATVSASGKVTMKKAGGGKKVTITATAQDGSGVKAKYTINIMKNSVKKISLKANSSTVKAGKPVTVKATVKTTGSKSVNKTLKWTSSNTKYATVDKNGKVKAKKAGRGKKVTITAKATDGSGKKASVKIKIK